MIVTTPSTLRQSVAALCFCGCSAVFSWLGGCHQTPAGAAAPPTAEAAAKGAAVEKPAAAEPAAAGEEAAEGLSLKEEDVKNLGIVTVDAVTTQHAPETAGFGVVLAHESIAQGVADLATAVAVERQSQSAYQRAKRLAGTAGAMPADSQEAAERQAIVDQAALELAKRRLSSTFGQHPPWKNQTASPELSALASGEMKLVRVTFPLGSLGDANPSTLRLGHIAVGPTGKYWRSASVWTAPADASVPGRSFFALLKGSDAGEGERLLAWAPVGEAEGGVVVPASAAIISNGKYWCYLETKPNVFVRTELDTSVPTAEGYFVKEGIAAGDKIVTASAGQLLARETNPSSAAE